MFVCWFYKYLTNKGIQKCLPTWQHSVLLINMKCFYFLKVAVWETWAFQILTKQLKSYPEIPSINSIKAAHMYFRLFLFCNQMHMPQFNYSDIKLLIGSVEILAYTPSLTHTHLLIMSVFLCLDRKSAELVHASQCVWRASDSTVHKNNTGMCQKSIRYKKYVTKIPYPYTWFLLGYQLLLQILVLMEKKGSLKIKSL